jgi:hypothetical protein
LVLGFVPAGDPNFEKMENMNLQEELCEWFNVRLAYQNASQGKRGREATET